MVASDANGSSRCPVKHRSCMIVDAKRTAVQRPVWVFDADPERDLVSMRHVPIPILRFASVLPKRNRGDRGMENPILWISKPLSRAPRKGSHIDRQTHDRELRAGVSWMRPATRKQCRSLTVTRSPTSIAWPPISAPVKYRCPDAAQAASGSLDRASHRALRATARQRGRLVAIATLVVARRQCGHAQASPRQTLSKECGQHATARAAT